MNDIIKKILSIDIKAQTQDDKEIIIHYTDFKPPEDMTISYDSTSLYANNVCWKQQLNGFSLDIKCNGFSIEIEECSQA